MEKGPEFRIVGDASAEKKEIEQALFNHSKSLSPQEKELLEKFEYPKSEEELALIDFANKETNELMQGFGLEPYDIPTENYHIVPTEVFKTLVGKIADNFETKAAVIALKQRIIFDSHPFRNNLNLAPLGASILHETIHLKSHFSIEIEEMIDKVETSSYRGGLVVASSRRNNKQKGHHFHFYGLNEAIVSAQEKKSMNKLFDLPELVEEKRLLMSDWAKELIENTAQKEKITEDDIMLIFNKNKKDFIIAEKSYREQRQTLDYVCSEIQKEFSDQYKSIDDVFKEFLKANFTGQLLTIGRLVEETFGKGSFRILGDMGMDSKSAILTLEILKIIRAKKTIKKFR